MAFPTPGFWAHFSENHWEKQPLVLRRPFAGHFAAPEDTFATLVRACDRFRAGESVRLRLFGEHGLIVNDLDRLLPVTGDGSFASYADRVTRDLKSPTFTLVSNYLHVHDYRLWDAARRFLAGLYAHVGIPADHADVDVFISNKRLTPFGIHRDPASNFTLVLEGRKTMRLWPQEFFERRPPMDAASYAGYLEHALTMEGEAGDLLYWPSQYWHVADSDGSLSVTMNISLYLDANAEAPGYPAVELVSQRARELVTRRIRSPRSSLTYAAGPAGPPEGADRLPEPILEVLQAFQELGRDTALARDVTGVWLNRLTGGGFNKVPPALPSTPLEDTEEIRLDPGFPILWRELAGEVAISGSGRTVFWPRASANVIAMIQRLNRGERIPVARLVQEFASTAADGAGLRSLLETLSSWRCLERAAARPSGEAGETELRQPALGMG